jgi:hypothetical protein
MFYKQEYHSATRAEEQCQVAASGLQAVGAQIGYVQQGMLLRLNMIEQLVGDLRKDVSSISDCESRVSTSKEIVQNIAVYVREEAVCFGVAFAIFMCA